MEQYNMEVQQALAKNQNSVVREYNINGKDYIVKSVFIGDKDVKTILLNHAARKAAEEMGLDYIGT